MHMGQEPSPRVLQSATGRFRGKWVDAEVLGRARRDGRARYLLFNDDYHDPFRSGRTGTINVVARSQGEKGLRFFCRVEFAEGPCAEKVPLGSKRITLCGRSTAIAPLVTNLEPILASGRGDGFSGAGYSEPSFWFLPLSGFLVSESGPHRSPAVKTYRRSRSDLRDRARHFCGKWVELAPSQAGEMPVSAVVAAFVAVSVGDTFFGELWIERESETSFVLFAEAGAGDSRIEMRETGEDLRYLCDLGLLWAASFSFLGRHPIPQLY